MTFWTLIAATAAAAEGAPARPQTPAQMHCRLISSDGAVVSFGVTTRERGGILEVKPGPTEAGGPIGSPADFLLPIGGREDRTYRLGGGADPFVLKLGHPYSDQDGVVAELARSSGDFAGVPTAFGYCSGNAWNDLVPATAVTQAEQRLEKNELGCRLLARDGRQSRFTYRTERGAAIIAPLDGTIWSDRSLTLRRISPPSPPASDGLYTGFATAGGEGLPQLTEMLFVNTRSRRAAVTMRFQSLAATAGNKVAGFAICGISDIDRI